MTGLPLNDWQFWVVSAMAAAAVVLVVWPLVRARKSECGGCGPAKTRPKRVAMTIKGENLR